MGLKSLLFKSPVPENMEAFIKQRAPISGVNPGEESAFILQVRGNHLYLEAGNGRPIIFCPGLYGSIQNFIKIARPLSQEYLVLLPYLPMYDLPLTACDVPRLGDYLQSFMDDLSLQEAVFIGSSMGGGAALHYTLKKESRAKGLVLCGSSGLSTIPLKRGFFKRKDYDFIKKTTQEVFYDPGIPSEEMIKEVYEAIQDYETVLRSIRFTKSTAKDQMHDKLKNIEVPVLLVWGKQDNITPPEVGSLFAELLPDAELHFIEHCGHVPTQEQPKQVLELIKNFLSRINYK